jgi:hypothetical protein
VHCVVFAAYARDVAVEIHQVAGPAGALELIAQYCKPVCAD